MYAKSWNAYENGHSTLLRIDRIYRQPLCCRMNANEVKSERFFSSSIYSRLSISLDCLETSTRWVLMCRNGATSFFYREQNIITTYSFRVEAMRKLVCNFNFFVEPTQNVCTFRNSFGPPHFFHFWPKELCVRVCSNQYALLLLISPFVSPKRKESFVVRLPCSVYYTSRSCFDYSRLFGIINFFPIVEESAKFMIFA